MVYTSKTLIPGKQPIGQNRDGSYIYDGQPMSVLPSKPITTQSTGIPNVGIPGVKGLTTPIAPTMSSKLPPVTFSADRAKEINARPTPTPAPTNTGYVPLTKEQFQKARAAGFTPEKIIEMEQRRKAQSVSQPEMSLNEKINKGGADFLAKGISGAISGTGNILGAGIKGVGFLGEKIGQGLDLVTPGDQSGFGKGVREMGQTIGGGIQQGGQNLAQGFENLQGKMSSQGPINQESVGAKIGEMVGEIVPTLYTGGILGKVPALAKLAKGGLKARTLSSAIIGGAEGGAYSVADTGKIDPTQVGIGTAIGAVIPGGGALLGGIAKKVSKTLPESLQVSNIVNAGDLQKTSVRLSKLYGKEADVTDVARWSLDRGIRGTEKEQVEQIGKWVAKQTQEKKQALSAVKQTFADDTTKSLQKALSEKIGLYTEKGIATAGNEAKVARYKELINKGKMTMSEVDEARSLLGDGLFTKQGTMKELANKEGWQKVWIDASKWVDDKLPGIRAVNKDIEVGIALSQAMAKKEATNAARQIASYLGFSGLTGVGVGTYTGDWEKGLQTAALGFGATQLVKKLRTPKVASNIAYYLNKLSPEARKAMNALKSGQRITVDDGLKLVDEIKLLPPPSGKPTSVLNVKGEVVGANGTLPGKMADKDIIKQSNEGYLPKALSRPPEALPRTPLQEGVRGETLKGLSKSETSPAVSGKPVIKGVQKQEVSIPSKKEVNTPIIQKIAKKQETMLTTKDIHGTYEVNGQKVNVSYNPAFGYTVRSIDDGTVIRNWNNEKELRAWMSTSPKISDKITAIPKKQETPKTTKKIDLPKEGGKSGGDIIKMLKDKPKKPARMVELEKKIQGYIDEFKKLDSDLGASEAKNKMMPDGKPNPEYIKARDELLEYRWSEDSKGNVTRKFYSDDTPEQIGEHKLWIKNNTKKPSLPLSNRTPVVYSKGITKDITPRTPDEIKIARFEFDAKLDNKTKSWDIPKDKQAEWNSAIDRIRNDNLTYTDYINSKPKPVRPLGKLEDAFDKIVDRIEIDRFTAEQVSKLKSQMGDIDLPTFITKLQKIIGDMEGDRFAKESLGEVLTQAKNALKKQVGTKTNKYLPMSSKTPTVYSKVDDLASEARKYKSAEEFVKAQGKTDYRDYLKNNIPEIENISKEGVITLKDGTKGELIIGEKYDIPEMYSFRLDKTGTGLGSRIMEAVKEWAVLKSGGETQIAIKRNVNPYFWNKVGFKEDKFNQGEQGWKWNSRTQPGLFDKTKQQLLDIYNKANK